VSLDLAASVVPDVLGSEPCDVEIRLALRNRGDKAVGIMPAIAKLSPIFSFAGVGITRELSFGVPMLELRTVNATADQLRGAKDDFLRGHVVGFFPGGGHYALRAAYAQHSWMNVGERHHVEAAPFPLRLRP
jgi:hypothetical protein